MGCDVSAWNIVEMWNRFVEVKSISGGILAGHTSEI